jgi:ribosomal protein S18 acetylase RimI-like enzyme
MALRSTYQMVLAAALIAAGAGHFATSLVAGAALPAALVVIGVLLTAVIVLRQQSGRGEPVRGAEEQQEGPKDLWRLRASVRDTPGRLAQLSGGLAELGGNIRAVHVHPTEAGAVDEILLHVPRAVTARELRRAVRAAGAENATAVRADVHELDDAPTRAFALAHRLVDGAELTGALRGEVEFVDAEHPEDLTTGGMLLHVPGGGMLRLRRHQPEFTPAEFARARAMVRLAGSCQRRDGGERVRAGGEELIVRRADRDDLDAVVRFHDSCSRAARDERYFSGASTNRLLRRLLTPALARTFVVVRGADVLAAGNLVFDGSGAEIGLLVRDDWQRRGLGVLLARRLVAEAEAAGVGEVRAQTRVHNAAIARTLRGAGFRLAGVAEPGEWSWNRPTGRPGEQLRPLCGC